MISESRIHKSVLNLNTKHFLSLTKIKEWYKYNEERRKDLRKLARKDKKMYSLELDLCEGYLKDMRHYLTHGDWISDFYGKEMEHKIEWTVVHSRKKIPYRLGDEKSNGLEDLTEEEYKELKIKAKRMELGLSFNGEKI